MAEHQKKKRFIEAFWEKTKNYRSFISTVVKEEINAASEELREKMMDKIREFEVLAVTVDVKELAEEYIRKEIFSERYKSDAIHVAVAMMNDMDFLISWEAAPQFKILTKRRSYRAL